jgi:hypothetical protein
MSLGTLPACRWHAIAPLLLGIRDAMHARQIIDPIRLAAAAFAFVACTGGADAPADSAAPPPPSAAAPHDSAAQWTVTEQGIGALRAGMSLAEVTSGIEGVLIVPAGADTASCTYAQWRGGPPGVSIMIERGRIARIDVDSGAVATSLGARIGDTEERIESLYVGRVAVTPHKYTEGRYLTVTPSASADSAYRIVFETEGGRVTRYRAGRRPAVEYVERCG